MQYVLRLLPQDKFINAYKERSDIFEMGFDTFKKSIDKLPLNVGIYFAGFSESWLNPECTKILLYAHQRGHKIVVFTTLVGMTVSDIDLLESVPLSGFNVHLPSEKRQSRIKIDENYLNVLKRLSQSRINASYHFLGASIHPKIGLIIKNIARHHPHSRGGNVDIENKPNPKRKRGIIGCARLHHNILLPNGDVVLCCTDFGMRHVLGNLLSQDYPSLFQSDEFLKVKKGQKDETLDILCRHCTDTTMYNVDLRAKIHNHFLPSLRNLFKRK